MIAATILSAGASTRMGHPKALLLYRGRTFLQSILDALAAVGVRRRLVVLGPDGANILSCHDLGSVTILTNEDLAGGPIGSIQLSIESIRHHPADGLLVWPVDFPHVELDTIRTLIDSFHTYGRPIVIPTYKGRRGHPTIFGRSVFNELMGVTGDGAPGDQVDAGVRGAKSVVHDDPTRRLEVPVDDQAVIAELNTPEAYAELLRRENLSTGCGPD